VNLTYNGSSAAPTNAGTYLVIGTLVDAIYKGGATITLVITNGVSNTSTNISMSVSGGQLTLAWPGDHLGWILQVQTNNVGAGLGSQWMDVPGSGSDTQAVIIINVANPAVFYRLRSP
jgi:hypothetical protein